MKRPKPDISAYCGGYDPDEMDKYLAEKDEREKVLVDALEWIEAALGTLSRTMVPNEIAADKMFRSWQKARDALNGGEK